MDRIWEYERERVDRWRSEINALLTFAGLFAAVISPFAVQYYTMLQPPTPVPDFNTKILEHISQQLADIMNQTGASSSRLACSVLEQSTAPEPPAPQAYVAVLWFAALVCGLGAAAIAISVNQWLNGLLTRTALAGKESREQMRVWNLRHETFRRWRLAVLIDIP
ncbi:uncharacterized protein B0H18DRAFT_874548, partial [Fomitopsis serialis]|uniref:uncharacterized protein n=1 Tax=Fomitopsis serialis TaxID=139415 RepID=UPI00200851A2